jgi:hypothetical protein
MVLHQSESLNLMIQCNQFPHPRARVTKVAEGREKPKSLEVFE